jgi:uncharacterized protein (DUF1810 family)
MTPTASDQFNLQRFVDAQESVYAEVLAELKAGRKRTHWMWFVFPQLAGLGSSPMARQYAVSGMPEARAYLAHPILGRRLIEGIQAMLQHSQQSPRQILGEIDAVKWRSCLTLFSAADPSGRVCDAALDQFYAGQRDEATMRLLNQSSSG